MLSETDPLLVHNDTFYTCNVMIIFHLDPFLQL